MLLFEENHTWKLKRGKKSALAVVLIVAHYDPVLRVFVYDATAVLASTRPNDERTEDLVPDRRCLETVPTREQAVRLTVLKANAWLEFVQSELKRQGFTITSKES